MEKNYLSYEDFGAVGDGVTDDFAAIIATHEEANRTNTPVKARDGAKYYIGGKNASANIMTDTDFGRAEFIIDDVKLENIRSHIFTVTSEFEPYEIEIKSLKKTDKKLDFPHEGKVYVKVVNSNRKMFIRRSLNLNNGADARDAIIVDSDGTILTDIDWDFDEVTHATARSVEDKPITIRGGIFRTIANQAESFYNYHARNFYIKRSNVTVADMTHYVTGEIDHGAPYAGFFTVSESYNVTIENCTLTPHYIYRTASKIPGRDVAMGSYDINVGESIKVKLIGISQTVNIRDTRYWGIFTSNFCKDLLLENCILSRFDAHQGVTNVTLKSCVFGHQCINLIGHGEALIEGCHIYGPRISDLRFDYGSIWDGDVTVRNCVWHPNSPYRNRFVTITATNTGDHDFGYATCMPHTLTIDGLTILDKAFPDCEFYVLPNYDDIKFYALPEGDTVEGKPFAHEPTHKLVLKNISFESGKEFKIAETPELYSDLKVEYN